MDKTLIFYYYKSAMNIEQVKKLNIPTTPGSYQYYDKAGKIIYIGKAANLRSRVLSYWHSSADHTPAKKQMVSKIAKIKWIETGSEIEALLLEANLVKKYQPYFNVDLKDDKRHIYIKITDDEWPRVLTTRNIIEPIRKISVAKTPPSSHPPLSPLGQGGNSSDRGRELSGRYFGPFTSGAAVRETIKAIGKIFPYGHFATMPENRRNELKSRRYPEIYGAPTDLIEYKKNIKEIIAFLEGRRKDIERDLKLEIAHLSSKEGNLKKTLSLRAEQSEAKQSRSSNTKHGIASSLPSVAPRNDIEEKIQRLKYRLLNMRNVLAHSNIISVHEKYAADTVELAKILGLPKVPERIEGYDISNLFGQEAVGSMVVFKNGEPDKSQYRKFKIACHCEESPERRRSNPEVDRANNGVASLRSRSVRNDKHDDTAMLKEILERRFKHMENPPLTPPPPKADKQDGGIKENWPRPDLIIIDGGKGQLNACLSILKKLKLNIAALAVSKGEGLRSAHAPDKIFFPGMKKPLILPLASPALHIIKRVRDEAHRFAIGFHRQRRSKKLFFK
jgi:excinuclease ABC subunit C